MFEVSALDLLYRSLGLIDRERLCREAHGREGWNG